jgi:hypothetical protein
MSIILCAFHHDLAHHFMHQNMWSYGHLSMPFAPSSRVLLMPNSKHLTHGISNLVSLITKTKLGLSISPFLVIDDNHHKDIK